MKKIIFLSILFFSSMAVSVFAAEPQPTNAMPAVSPQPATSQSAAPADDLNQFIYSYGTILKANAGEVVLQEYDYDSDVEKEVTYQVDPAVKLEGVKAVTDLVPDDVVEVYYLEQDGKKTAKIIRKEAVEEDSSLTKNNRAEDPFFSQSSETLML